MSSCTSLCGGKLGGVPWPKSGQKPVTPPVVVSTSPIAACASGVVTTVGYTNSDYNPLLNSSGTVEGTNRPPKGQTSIETLPVQTTATRLSYSPRYDSNALGTYVWI